MNTKFILLTCSLILWNVAGLAQKEFSYSEPINRYSPDDKLKEFLTENKLSEIWYSPFCDSCIYEIFPFRVKQGKHWYMASPKMGLGEEDEFGKVVKMPDFLGYTLNELKGYEIDFPDSVLNSVNGSFVYAKRKGQTYLGNLDSLTVYASISFDSLDYVIVTDSETVVVEDEFGDQFYETYVMDRVDYVRIQKDQKWALGMIDHTGIYQLTGAHFKREQLNDSLVQCYRNYDYGYFEYNYALLEQTTKLTTNNAELGWVKPIWYNVHNQHMWVAQNAITKKWTVSYNGAVPDSVTLPLQMDRMVAHDGTDSYLEVWQNGKVGFYNAALTQFQPCQYDEIVPVFLDYITVIALKKENMWQMYHMETAQPFFDQKAGTVDELIELWLNRFDESETE